MRKVLITTIVALLLACNHRRNLLTYATHDPVLELRVLDANRAVLWDIQAMKKERLAVVHYGHVPPGFRQLLPVQGMGPRPFRNGESITIDVLTSRETFEHSGTAAGADEFRGGVWQVTPLR